MSVEWVEPQEVWGSEITIIPLLTEVYQDWGVDKDGSPRRLDVRRELPVVECRFCHALVRAEKHADHIATSHSGGIA